MPQIFQVLRCYKCFVFQVHQTKKSNKWECKLCGEKQSIKRHYGIGTAKDCRLHVQKLNTMRGEMDNKEPSEDQDSYSDGEDALETGHNCSSTSTQSICKSITSSKWSNYLDEPEIIEEPPNDSMNLGDAEVVLEIPKKPRKAVKRNNTYNKDYENLKESSPPPKIVPFSSSSTELNTLPLTSNSENLISQIDSISNIKPNAKKFIPPVVNKNSKWAQFTESTEECTDTDYTNSSQNLELSQNNAMFSLCDDSDLDNLLNI
ncbi:hypothetical protein HF086_001377 [Spodoptera exigua]|uniref:MRN complex-interacting protein N-terminal domain-containing protein n=1 Tax=Spodoptera exigua TaxID=7107 RepID=A0A922SE04_SPOEX|nr:hypothetical protein HF086_001377 [Spodoptera exigua]